MLIHIDFFKPSGKWYEGGDVEIRDGSYLWSDDLKQQIVNNQDILMDGWQDCEYTVVLTDTPENISDSNYRGFFRHMFHAGSFKGLKRAKD
jgi:hypothetical protein